MKDIERYVTSIPDYPKPGVIFRDITTVVGDADGLALAVDTMSAFLEGVEFDAVVGLESRGFLLGAPIAYKLHKPFLLIRKKGKLPRKTISASYDLEYGSAEIEIHKEDIRPGQRVVLVDDLLATGGTLSAAVRLVEQLGGTVVKILCLMELKGLHGRSRLSGYSVDTALAYEGT